MAWMFVPEVSDGGKKNARRFTLFTPPSQMSVSLIYDRGCWCCCCRCDVNPDLYTLTHALALKWPKCEHKSKMYPWPLSVDFIQFKLNSPTTTSHGDDIHALYVVFVASSMFIFYGDSSNSNLIFSTFFSLSFRCTHIVCLLPFIFFLLLSRVVAVAFANI